MGFKNIRLSQGKCAKFGVCGFGFICSGSRPIVHEIDLVFGTKADRKKSDPDRENREGKTPT